VKRRRGFTLLELVAVLAVLIILGAVLVPTLSGVRGDTRSKAGADTVRGFMAEARSKAMEDGQAYRIAVSPDGRTLRVSPESSSMNMGMVDDGDTSPALVREDTLPDAVTAKLLTDENDDAATTDEAGWIRIATFLADGTCREDTVEVVVSETGVAPFVVRLRGLTGVVSIYRGQLNNAGASR
jgi:prepilin-type N-terminal cleavage/methylation domain-containing protein